MSIENLINKINVELNEYESSGTPSPADEEEINKFKREMEREFNYLIPSYLEELLSYSNGVMFNGLTIWPTQQYWLFHESFAEANLDLRERINENYIYFGNRDEELYIYNPITNKYEGIEYIGDTAWVQFDSLDVMFEFMLNRSLEED